MSSKVCFHVDPFTAEMIRNLLEENGLHPLPLSSTVRLKVLQGVRGSDIEVPDQEVDLARKLISGKETLRKHVVTCD